MKIVVDTNVLISMLLWKQRVSALADIINERKVHVYFSLDTIEELYRVAEYPKIKKQAQKVEIELDAVIDQLVSSSVIVFPNNVVSVITKDPSDNMFLACAFLAEADFIISGDKHLLDVGEFGGISIVTPAKFLKRFKGK